MGERHFNVADENREEKSEEELESWFPLAALAYPWQTSSLQLLPGSFLIHFVITGVIQINANPGVILWFRPLKISLSI